MGTGRPGYDSPASTREEDELDRWRFASDIVEIITTTPSDWSVRVGVFGKWGEGKSSVLHFIERMLEDDGHLVFWFNPWAARDWNHLWDEFTRTFVEALDRAGVKLTGLGWIKSKLWFWRVHTAVERLSGADRMIAASVGATLSLLQKTLEVEGAQISRICEKLGQKRVVVLVDDLDRVDPTLVPQLLLAFREVLDLPGFAFVLGFDDEMVGVALERYHPAWKDGRNFIDKIVDFRFALPQVTASQRIRLLQRRLQGFALLSAELRFKRWRTSYRQTPENSKPWFAISPRCNPQSPDMTPTN